jgi:hypothetical protein
MIARFREGSFECQICECGEAVTEEQYLAALAALLADSWCFKPPKKLLTAFRATRASLPGRLTPDLLERLNVASDSATEIAAVETLRSRLPEIRTRLEGLPLHVFNPDMTREDLSRFPSGKAVIMNWARWAIEPVGVDIPTELHDRLPGLVERLNSCRAELTSPVTVQDIQLASTCWVLEHRINNGRYKAALRKAAEVIACL